MTKTFTIEVDEQQLNIIRVALAVAVDMQVPPTSDEELDQVEETQLMVDMVDMIDSMKAESDQPDYDPDTIHGFCR